jgi:hypothetical protein
MVMAAKDEWEGLGSAEGVGGRVLVWDFRGRYEDKYESNVHFG